MIRPPFLEVIDVCHFRSINYEGIQFDNPLLLVGRNGAGKSNFVDVLAFLAECVSDPLQTVFDRRGGVHAVWHRLAADRASPHISIQARFRLSSRGARTGEYHFRIRPMPDGSFVVDYEQCAVVDAKGRRVSFVRRPPHLEFQGVEGLRPRLEPQRLALPIVGGVEEFAPLVTSISDMQVYSIDPARIREWQDSDPGKRLKRDGSNLASVLERLERSGKETIQWMADLVGAVVPGITQIRPVPHGKKISLQFTQEWAEGGRLPLEASAMSDGTLRLLGIVTAIMQRPTPSLIAIEEPETSVHPGALGAVLDVLRIAVERTQVVVTTQSPDLLYAKWIRPDNLRIVTWERGATHILPLATHTASILQDRLTDAGELLRANALDAVPVPEGEARGATLVTH